MKRILSLLCCVLTLTLLSGCVYMVDRQYENISVEEVPPFSLAPYVVLGENIPAFTEDEYTTQAYEKYSSLDFLGRCGPAMACLGEELFPTAPREAIGSIKPSGWHTIKYENVNGKYLYNRCHLIGFQLSGENKNERNLITGTRFLNTEGMLPFENMVADYIRETGNHVLYRVTPIFRGNNLLCDGVTIEALSMEDGGEGIQFYVFCYNAQPGIVIDHATGKSYAQTK